MSTGYAERLARLEALAGDRLFAGARRGVERETLRVDGTGHIAATRHPTALGSALTNAFITTDYSEALLEFVTPPEDSVWEAVSFLCQLHHFTANRLQDECLWPMSMPCDLRSDLDIPLARYGSSNVGRMKTIYRQGLAYRYGRFMQVISGVHFNYSLPRAFWDAYLGDVDDRQHAISDAYLGMVRNVRRSDWLLLYLYGASPTVATSFLRDSSVNLEHVGDHTAYGRYATSLRMSDLGYQNSNQAALYVSANSVDAYVEGLAAATSDENAEYAKIGVNPNGFYRQLSAAQLQIENEYYSTIRPKRVALSGEKPSSALRRGGIEYVELRALDVSPHDPVGVNSAQMRFLEVYLVYCLLQDSAPIAVAERQENRRNHLTVAFDGRNPECRLLHHGEQRPLRRWARGMIDAMRPIAEMMDVGGDGRYAQATETALQSVLDPELTPSARLLDDVLTSGRSHVDYGLEVAQNHRDYFASLTDDLCTHEEQFTREAADSLRRQKEIEAADSLSFEAYLSQVLGSVS